jgi:hypothetical protein
MEVKNNTVTAARDRLGCVSSSCGSPYTQLSTMVVVVAVSRRRRRTSHTRSLINCKRRHPGTGDVTCCTLTFVD